MKLDQVNNSALQSLLKNMQRQSSKNSGSSTAPGDAVSLSNPAQLGNRIIQFSLSQSLTIGGKRYNVSQKDDSNAATSSTDGSLFDYKKVAENVLSFVTNTIRAHQQAGENNDKLKSMLDQAYKGIDQGFSDARKELDKNGLLTDPLKEGIDKSYNLIQKGMTDFEKELFGTPADGSNTATTTDATTADAATATNTASTTTPATTDTTSAAQVKTPKEIGNSILAAFMGQESATLELTTKEGDKVTIQFDDQQLWRQQQSSGLAKKAIQTYGQLSGSNSSAKPTDTTNAGTTSGSVFYSHTAQFSFKVEGDLNSSELKSISDMVNKVGSLSDSFFNGNISDALQQAKQLDLGGSDLSSLSLNLYQQQALGWAGNTGTSTAGSPTADQSSSSTTPAASSSTDNKTSADQPPTATSLPDVFGKLNDYLKQLQALFDQMSGSLTPDAQSQLQGWVAQKQHPEQSNAQIGQFVSFNQYMQQVMTGLQSGQTTTSEPDRTAT
ncbi:DUF5610 domain-containing protein [Tolumonas lignilytica]|uniref:DUF5610 domain-containing protein n=1 Tax=Tolumonas lignilytica TaxID=1283284 RepID=UPI000464722A|nr:DUF5610 domain-containing protein [Tolumonas lignilytica]